MSAAARAVIALAAWLAPRRLRAAWREEWHAEVDAVTRSRGGFAALRFAASAPIDAVLSRWTTRGESLLRGALRSMQGAWGTDIKQTARSVMRSPGHVLMVSLCLGVGIAVCTTTFSILNAF